MSSAWKVDAGNLGGHGGGDERLVKDFTQAIAQNDPSPQTPNLAVSLESHLIGLKAEESRERGIALAVCG